MNQRTLLIIGIIVLLVLIVCMVCTALFGFGTAWFLNVISTPSGPTNTGFNTPTESSQVTPPPLNTQPASDETLVTLENAIVPDNDPVALAERLKGIKNIPATVPYGGPRRVGDEQKFYVTNTDTNTTSTTTATLRYVSDIVYFWVENGVNFNQRDLENLAHAFEDKMYPTDRNFFGSEWYPGIDNDPHIYILYTTGMGAQVAGYFSSVDEIPPLARSDSNAHEMFLFNADNSPLDDPYTYGVLAHEFQHMIHWYRDRNETSWINEGMSELATLLNDYVHIGFIQEYIFDPDLQLTDWPNDPSATTPHYGAGMSFTTYFLDRFGSEATQALVADAANGMDSVDDVMKQLNITNTETGKTTTGDDVVLDWMITNYLGDSSVGDSRYAYNNYPQVFEQASPTEYVNDCSPTVNARDVHQYGVDYIQLSCSGQTTLHFQGATQTGLLPVNAYSGNYAFWSNKGDESDMTLTHTFDFSHLSGPITLNYETWYDLEKDYDYVFLEASPDGGTTWQILTTPSGTADNPSGNSYGWGYNALSGGGSTSQWIQEAVDLSQFAGKQVLLRFEYVTDAAVNGEGFMIDDISIPQANYSEDFESGDGGWQAAGFARVENVLPQTFRLALIAQGNQTNVQIIDVPATETVDIPLDFNSVDTYTLVVTGTTRFTRQEADYQFWFQ